VLPHRGSQGQRLYDQEQIALLHVVLAQRRRGSRARAAHSLALQPQPLRTAELQFMPAPQASRLARNAITELALDLGDAQFRFDLRLVASELVKNAVAHSPPGEPITLRVRLYPSRAELILENRGKPLRLRALRTVTPGRGRGLEIVDALAESWTIDACPDGTRVRVCLPLAGRGASPLEV
jgi:anti-sigma regulatory factor (Ser/Thr protein kinase)